MNLDKLFQHLVDEHGLLLLESEKREIADCLPRWYSVDEAMPADLELVWLSDGKGWTDLGCYFAEGNCWAIQDSSICEEDGKIAAECELEDVDVKFWHPLPKPIRS